MANDLTSEDFDTTEYNGAAVNRINRDMVANWLLTNRVPLLFLCHMAVFSLSYWVAFCLRFDLAVPLEYINRFWTSLPLLLLVKLTVFLGIKSIHGWWRFVTFADFVSIARASFIAFVLVAIIDYFVLPFQIPRVVLVLDFIVATGILMVLRSSWRLVREGIWTGVRVTADCKPALMISNHHDSIVLAHQINSRPGSKYRIVGILSDDRKRIGSTRAGIPIVGSPEDAPKIAPRLESHEIWIAAGQVPGTRLKTLKQAYDVHNLEIKVIPPTLEFEGSNGQIPVRDIDINDLLQREPVQLDTEQIRTQLRGKRVLVTGAGGSIGSEICRQIIRFKPSELVLVDHRENSIFLIHNELERTNNEQTELVPAVGDILDEARMRDLFEQHRPEFVYHAAAHKHVGLMEMNPGEAVKNNIFGTKAIADLAKEYGSIKFVLISTDKAVNPTSVMGATKHIAERYVHCMAQDSTTAFMVVRFGNVLGSNGSVVPLFKEQISRGGPISITDARMKRFFMTIPEAAQLVLQAASMGNGGEIFVLEMGEQVHILELAKEMIKLSGLPEHSIEIEFIGSRPGEKLYEELYFDEEQMLETSHPKIHAAYHRTFEAHEIQLSIESLQRICAQSGNAIRAELKRLVPDYRWPNSTQQTVSP